ncbi:hypothetical protein CHARACLAT_015799 [Characodon lateralis]|uniref:Uncharacterized protein n=1 Tax=Characodon lateralis TaxID=208331 RepID=A0ABU7DKY2_9TELE|nr:hypothetical protein [Characodon lateralis]
MMYTITRGPSKLVTQRRTGPTQQIESKVSDLKLKPTSWLASNAPPPKIVFNRVNGKRHNGTATQKSQSLAAEGFTPAHEENVRFVYEGEDYRTSGPRCKVRCPDLILKPIEICHSEGVTEVSLGRLEAGHFQFSPLAKQPCSRCFCKCAQEYPVL